MPDFIYEFAIRFAVMLPALVLLAALTWSVLEQFGFLINGAFNAADMRTWPLGFIIADAVLFAAILAAAYVAFGDNPLSAGVAGGLAALIGFGLMPRLAARFLA